MAPQKPPAWSNVATHGVENATARARARSDVSLDRPPASATQDSVDYLEEQNYEIEALQSIYPDEFEDVEIREAWKSSHDRAFRLRVISFENPDINVTLFVRLTASYPRTIPPIELENLTGLKEKTVQAMQSFLQKRTREMQGQVMIFDLADGIRDILDEAARNKVVDDARPNLAQEHAQSEAKAAEIAAQEKEEERKLAEEAEADRERVLNEMLNREQARREDQARRRNKSRNMSNGVTDGVFVPIPSCPDYELPLYPDRNPSVAMSFRRYWIANCNDQTRMWKTARLPSIESCL
jgi:eukaryotic translation initiation factor 2-alpha kinase 4